MEVKAQLRHLRIAPRKVRLVADQLRGLPVVKAEQRLAKMTKRSSVPVLKLIKSAAANAEHNHQLSKETLYIKTIQVDEGLTLKRWMPRAMGRATPLRKRASHVVVVLDVLESAKQAARAKKNTETTKDVEKKEAKPVKAEKATATEKPKEKKVEKETNETSK